MKALLAFTLSILPMLCPAASSAPISNAIGIVAPGKFVPPRNIAGVSRWIPIMQIRQETNLCVPTSTAMVLAYSGQNYSPREIKDWSRGLEYDPSQLFNDFTPTYFADLLKGLAQHSIHWTDQVFEDTHAGFCEGVKEIEKQIDGGHAVLVDTSLYTGHVFVIAGYDHTKGCVIAVDPFIEQPGIREIPYSALEVIWNSNRVGSDLRAVILTN